MRRNILLWTLIQIIVSGAVFGFTAAFAQAEVVPGSCDLYTRADAEALFNEDVSEGVMRETVSPKGNSCRYTFRKDGDVFGVTVRIATTRAISEEGIYDSAKDVFDRQTRARKSNEEAAKKYREIDGLGEGAFWEGTALWVLRGDVLLVIKVNSVLEGSFDSREALDAAQEDQDLALSLDVAGTVLPRLQ